MTANSNRVYIQAEGHDFGDPAAGVSWHGSRNLGLYNNHDSPEKPTRDDVCQDALWPSKDPYFDAMGDLNNPSKEDFKKMGRLYLLADGAARCADGHESSHLAVQQMIEKYYFAPSNSIKSQQPINERLRELIWETHEFLRQKNDKLACIRCTEEELVRVFQINEGRLAKYYLENKICPHCNRHLYGLRSSLLALVVHENNAYWANCGGSWLIWLPHESSHNSAQILNQPRRSSYIGDSKRTENNKEWTIESNKVQLRSGDKLLLVGQGIHQILCYGANINDVVSDLNSKFHSVQIKHKHSSDAANEELFAVIQDIFDTVDKKGQKLKKNGVDLSDDISLYAIGFPDSNSLIIHNIADETHLLDQTVDVAQPNQVFNKGWFKVQDQSIIDTKPTENKLIEKQENIGSKVTGAIKAKSLKCIRRLSQLIRIIRRISAKTGNVDGISSESIEKLERVSKRRFKPINWLIIVTLLIAFGFLLWNIGNIPVSMSPSTPSAKALPTITIRSETSIVARIETPAVAILPTVPPTPIPTLAPATPLWFETVLPPLQWSDDVPLLFQYSLADISVSYQYTTELDTQNAFNSLYGENYEALVTFLGYREFVLENEWLGTYWQNSNTDTYYNSRIEPAEGVELDIFTGMPEDPLYLLVANVSRKGNQFVFTYPDNNWFWEQSSIPASSTSELRDILADISQEREYFLFLVSSPELDEAFRSCRYHALLDEGNELQVEFRQDLSGLIRSQETYYNNVDSLVFNCFEQNKLGREGKFPFNLENIQMIADLTGSQLNIRWLKTNDAKTKQPLENQWLVGDLSQFGLCTLATTWCSANISALEGQFDQTVFMKVEGFNTNTKEFIPSYVFAEDEMINYSAQHGSKLVEKKAQVYRLIWRNSP